MANDPVHIAANERIKAERRAHNLQAVELRKSGHSFRQIAEIQKCNIKTAIRRYNTGIKQYIPVELIESVRATELDRFDQMTIMNMAFLAKAYEDGDVETFIKVQGRLYDIHDRRKKLIPIEVPTIMKIESETVVTTSQDRELADLLSRTTQEVEDRINGLRANAEPRTRFEDLDSLQ